MKIDTPLARARADADVARTALDEVKDYLARRPSTPGLIDLFSDGTGGTTLRVPREAVELLARVLAHMAAGEGVSIVPDHAQLTTQQAADVLNVSRPYLIKLLDAGEIEYRLVGKHRRIQVSSLLEYRKADDRRRRAAADELSALTQQLSRD